MPAGREAEFKAGFSKFYDATKVDFPMCTKFSGFNEFTRFTMSPKGFLILHILHVHLSRTVHTYNALFTLEGRQGRIWLSLLWLRHPRELRLLQGGICGRLWQKIYLTERGICGQCNKHLSYQKRDEQSLLYWCCFYGHPIVSQIRMLKQLFCTELM